MIVCPNCNHHNPEGATQCESCYTPLPEMMPCSNCGAQVQVDANFCGQCGTSIQPPAPDAGLPTALEAPSPTVGGEELEPLSAVLGKNLGDKSLEGEESENAGMASLELNNLEMGDNLDPTAMVPGALGVQAEPAASPEVAVGVPPKSSATTQLQSTRAVLLHLRTNVEMTLPENLSVIHIGKPNDRVPPDIDVSGFPDSEVVSRVHADIRVEGDAFYIEDLGSSNGTYINNLPLAPGNRHRLRMGDRIALGKGDLVTFLFQVA